MMPNSIPLHICYILFLDIGLKCSVHRRVYHSRVLRGEISLFLLRKSHKLSILNADTVSEAKSVDSKSWSWKLRCIVIVRKVQSYKYVCTHIAITCNIICLCIAGTRASYSKRKLVEYHRVQHRFSAFWLRSSHSKFRWRGPKKLQ